MSGFPLQGPSAVLSRHTPSSKELMVLPFSFWVFDEFSFSLVVCQSFPSPISLLEPWEPGGIYFAGSHPTSCCSGDGKQLTGFSSSFPSPSFEFGIRVFLPLLGGFCLQTGNHQPWVAI